MVWYASVDLTVTIDYDNIEADTEQEAVQIAEERARKYIDYNKCDASLTDMDVFVSKKN